MKIIDILSLPEYEGSKVLSGSRYLEKDVLNVTFLDAPDGYQWFKESDFIITTGFPFVENEKEWKSGLRRFVQILLDMKCSGLGIKFGRHIPYLTEEVAELSETYCFPIIHLPDHPAWADFIVPVITHINQEQRQQLLMTHDVYEKFHRLFSRRGDLQDVVCLLSGILKKEITFYIHLVNEATTAFSTEQVGEEMASIIRDNVVSGLRSNSKMPSHDYFIKWIDDGFQLEGAIFIANKDDEFEPWELVAIEQATAILMSEIDTIRNTLEFSQKYRNSFLVSLLEGYGESKESVLRKAQEVGWVLEDCYCVVVLNNNSTKLVEVQMETYQKKMATLQLLNRSLDDLLPGTLSGFDSQNRFVLLVPVRKKNTEHGVKEKMGSLLSQLNLDTSYGGVGRAVSIEDGIPESYQEALIACRSATASSSRIISFRELSFERILYSSKPIEEAGRIANELLGEIIAYDQERNGDLFVTLKTFLDNDSNYQKTSQDLFVHKNTIRYRLNTIREVTNYNPEDSKDKMLFLIAFNVFQK